MTRVVPYSKNREILYDWLTRARRYHATITSIHEIDVTELIAALGRRRAAGQGVSFLACLVKATGLVMARYPRLNHHLFHGTFRKVEVDFEEISCTLVVMRKEGREMVLLPANLERPHERTIEDLDAEIRRVRTSKLEELPQFRGMQALKRLPRPALKLFSYLCRSNAHFYRRFFGTYGISPLLLENEEGVIEGRPGVATTTFANNCTAFMPSGVADHAVVVDGAVTVRKMLTTLMAIDHFLVDGHDALMAIRHLTKLLADPERIGLAKP